MFTKMGFGSNLSMLMSNIILLGRQYCILYKPNHHFLNFWVCYFLPFKNQITVSPIEKVLILWFYCAHNTVFHYLVFVRFVAFWQVSSKCSNLGIAIWWVCKLEYELVSKSWKAYSNYIPSMSVGIFLTHFNDLSKYTLTKIYSYHINNNSHVITAIWTFDNNAFVQFNISIQIYQG